MILCITDKPTFEFFSFDYWIGWKCEFISFIVCIGLVFFTFHYKLNSEHALIILSPNIHIGRCLNIIIKISSRIYPLT